MRMPAFTRTLHFRISGLFLLLLAAMAGGFWFWLNETMFQPNMAAEEEDYFENRSEGELDSLAIDLVGSLDRVAVLNDRLADYGKKVGRFGVELVVYDPAGRNLGSTNPDSMAVVLPTVADTLLQQMSLPDWDYSSYPNPDDVDAYVNRIFEVDRILVADDPDSSTAAYLVASYRPLTIGIEEIEGDERALTYQAVLLILVYSALSGLVIMAWLSRRISQLSGHMEAFAEGNLARRAGDGSQDEIGRLGRRFNRMAESIEQMVEKLQLKEQFQRQLIANISHDLRTPMASMRGYAETLTLQGDKLTKDDRDRYLNIIAANLDHLDNLIDHMLTLSRFESGQTVFQMEEFPLAELADSVLTRCEPLGTEAGVALNLECGGQDTPMVKADPLQIAQVLQNLVENGIKFNRPGGKVTIRIAALEGKRVAIGVTDTGVGIPPEDLPHIFERFYTGDKSRSRTTTPGVHTVKLHLGQSSGLGLAIAAKIVAGHDGELQVDSTVGKGTRFHFTLPAAEDSAAMEGEGS